METYWNKGKVSWNYGNQGNADIDFNGLSAKYSKWTRAGSY